MRLIVDNLLSLGGRLRLGTKVERILVANGAATGVQLAGGETIAADWVISAADGHATIYDMLGGKYTDKATDKIYGTLKTFPSYLQVSLGVARDLSQQAGYVMRLLDAPLTVDSWHPASAGLVPLLSLRSDIRVARKDRGHLLSSDL